MGSVSNSRVFSNLFWKLFERFGAQGVTFVVSIILARLLDPVAYGTVAIVTVFTSILQVFLDSGFSSALIQKKDCDDLDFSTVFYFQLGVGTGLYLLMFFLAPVIAEFYQMEELVSLIRVMSLSLLISSVKGVQSAYVSRHLMFKKFFFSTSGGTIIAACVGIIMAFKGLGAWALVAQSLVNATVGTMILWFTVPWRPKLIFSKHRLKTLYSFGWKILASSFVDVVYNNLRSLIIGKKYTSESLAFYNKGKVFPNMVVSNINNSIDAVLLPVMSDVQDNLENVRRMTRRAIKISTYIMFPLMMGLSVCAVPLIRILLTDKWIPCVLFLRIFCFTYAFYPIHTANLNAIKAMGRSDIFLKLEIIKKIVGFAAIFMTMFISVEAMAYSLIVTSVLSQMINAWPNKKLLNYSYIEQLEDIFPGIFLSCIMGACIYPISLLKLPELLILVMQILLGVCIYIMGSKVLKIDSFEYLWSIVKQFLNKRMKRK